VDGGAAGAAQRDLCRDRRALRRLPIDRALISARRKHEPRRAPLLASVAAIVVVALAIGLWIIRGPRRLPSRTVREWRARIIRARPHLPTRQPRQGQRDRARRLSGAGRTDCVAAHRERRQGLCRRSRGSSCRSARLLDQHHARQRPPASAITAIRIFSTPFIAQSAAMACGFIRRCRLRPTPTMTDEDALAIKAYLFSLPTVRAAAPANTLSLSIQPALVHDLLVGTVQSGHHGLNPTHRRARSGTGALYLAEALAHCGEMPYAAKSGVCAGQPQKIRWRSGPQAGAPSTSVRSKATGVGGLARPGPSSPIFRPDMRKATAPPRDRWAKPWTTASVNWRRKISAP